MTTYNNSRHKPNRRFYNIPKIFGFNGTLSSKTKCLILNLLSFSSNDHVHNLSSVKNVPIKFRAILMLGLKYCVTKSPNLTLIIKALSEAIRKIAWVIHFKSAPLRNSSASDFLIQCKKDARKITHSKGTRCNIENDIFDVNSLFNDVLSKIRRYNSSDSHFFIHVINDFRSFCNENNLMIIEADKNAGICIVNVKDYDQEVLSQLNNLNTYQPSTWTHFSLSMIEFKDRWRRFNKNMPLDCRFNHIPKEIEQPAKFYILPKVHKKFDNFPKGRPISSTFLKANKLLSYLTCYLNLVSMKSKIYSSTPNIFCY